MTGRTHDVAAFTALVIIFVLLPEIPSMTLATAVTAFGANFIGGLFPDIDQSTSDLWDNFRLGPVVKKIIVPRLGGHRNLSHSLLGFVIIGFLLDKLFILVSDIVLIDFDIVWWSFMIGVISHLFTDSMTKAVIPIFWPFKFTLGVPPIKRLRMKGGGFTENFIIFPGLFILSGYLLYMNQEKVLELFRMFGA